MLKQGLVQELTESEEYFNRSTACLLEEHSGFRPQDEMMTTAQQVAHVGVTIEWFLEGAFSEDGFDLDFESHVERFLRFESLSEARALVAKAFAEARDVISGRSEDELRKLLPEGPVMGGAPTFGIVASMSDHTAHHRGALSVYSRLLGLVPAMPYMDE